MQEYLDKLKKLQEVLLEFLDEESDTCVDSGDIKNIIFEYQNQSNSIELQNLLILLHKITIFHHRSPSFFIKIKQILVKLKNVIQNFIANSQIFDIFKDNKRILLILFEEKIITADDKITKILTDNFYNKQFYYFYFYPELSNFLNPTMNKRAEKKINKDQPNKFELNRQKGENEYYISELIRNDSISEFVTYLSESNTSISSKIKPSIFETNSFLLTNEIPTFIEYAAFYGSISIFNYLRLSKAKLTPSLWLYAIHGRNAEIIHILEENHVKLPNNSINECLELAIKCHHNEIAEYIINNFINEENEENEENIYLFAYRYNNYYFFAEEVKFKSTIINAFDFGLAYRCSSLPKITIPSSIKSIGNKAFNDCSSLIEVTFEENSSLISIENEAFNGCSSLQKITIPSSVTSIGNGAFNDCSSLIEVTIPPSVTSISTGCFSGCSSLKEITLHSSIASIEDYAFRDCKSLTNIDIPSSVTSIGCYAFEGCSSLMQVTISTNLKEIKSFLFSWCCSLKKVTIPSSVDSIGVNSFKNCTQLAKVIIPSSVKCIDYGAFEGCSSLEEVTIPSSLTKIKNSTFKECRSLSNVKIPSSVTQIEQNAFSGCSSLKQVLFEKPPSLEYIGDFAFNECNSLEKIEIPSSVTEIGDEAFNKCPSSILSSIPSHLKKQ